MRPDLSIIILSFNTETTTENCLVSLVKNLSKSESLLAEILIVDNASSDGSVDMIKKFAKQYQNSHIEIVTVFNKKNKGFGGGNNQAIKLARGKYVLFLNSDTIIDRVNFKKVTEYMSQDSQTGALTVKVLLPNGKIDPASHRGFPTIWNSFTYFLKFEKISHKIPFLNRIFGGYHLTHLNLAHEHEIDSPTGAFYLVKKEVLQKVGGFDDHLFFMYGEDLDLSYRIKNAGYKIIYYPYFTVIHLKYKSGIKLTNPVIQQNTKNYFYDSMKNFYFKHYSKKHSRFVNQLVYLFINIKKRIS